MTQKQTYVNWLNTAYAMEIDIRKTLEGQLDDAQDYPKALLKQRS
jgi:ferritin-like metal-binding protein YciE